MATYKYAKYTIGQIEAVFNILGGKDAVDALLRGDKGVKIEDVIIKLFDKNGRCIPSRTLQANVCDPNRNFHIVQPNVVLSDRFNRLVEALGCGVGISGADFENEIALASAELKGNQLLQSILNGVCLPIIVPQLDLVDYGNTLDTTALPAVERAYQKEFKKLGKSKFVNYRKGDLAGKVSVIKGVHHDRIIERLKHGPVIGLYFPNTLQGYSVQAQREQIATLPEQFSLAGLETAFAMMMYPDILARDFNTLGYDLSALQWRGPGYSLYFKAHGDWLGFSNKADLGGADDSDSGGLLFVR